MTNNHDEIDSNAIERLHANQNRIQTPNNLFTNNEQAFLVILIWLAKWKKRRKVL